MLYRLFSLFSVLLCLNILNTSAQHYITPPFITGNPRGLNQDDEYPFGGGLDASWTSIQGSSSTPVWSPVQTLPFPVTFNGNTYTSYKVSTSGVLTFDVGASSVPDGNNTSLPSGSIPDNSICVWGLDAPGSNDNIVVKDFGTSPNRQHWVFFSSFNFPGGAGNCWIYWSIVFEETTNRIYIVDQRFDGSCTASLTLGLQYNNSQAIQASGSPNIGNTSGIDATPANNLYWTFVPGTQPQLELELTELTFQEYEDTSNAPYQVTGMVTNMGANTITSFTMNYTVNGGTASGLQTFNVNLLSYQTYAFTLPNTWIHYGAGSYDICPWIVFANQVPDEDTSNNLLCKVVTVLDSIFPKMVLHEEFTSSASPPDFPANVTLKALLDANPGLHTLVKYPMSWPGTGDPYFTSEGEDRRFYYGANSTPSMWVNGSGSIHPSNYVQGDLESFFQTRPLLGIKAEHQICPDSQKISVSVDVTAGAGLSAGVVLRVAVVEKTTYNNATTSGESEFYNVMKKMLTSSQGTFIQGLGNGNTQSFNFTYFFQGNYRLPTSANDQIDHSTEHSVEEFGDLVAVAWVEDSFTLEVYNSTYSIGDTVCIDPVLAHAGQDVVICSGTSTQIGGSPAATGGAPPYTYQWTPVTGLSNPTIAQPTASPPVNTVYTLQVTDSQGSTDTDEVTVNIVSVSIGVIINQCDSVATLEGDPGLIAYQWSTGETTQNIVVNTDGSYSYIAFHPSGCLVNSPVATVVLPDLPEPVITQNGNVLSTGTQGNHQWYLNGFLITGANQPTYTILISGNYTVRVQSNQLCFGWSPVYFATLVVGCPEPTDVTTVNITPTSARFVWTPAPGAFKYIIWGRASGATNWVTLLVAGGTTNFKNVVNLGNNITYEWQIQTQCDSAGNDLSPWSALQTFTTGCQTPDTTWTAPVTASGAQLHWATVNGAHGYEIKGRRVGGGWATILVGGPSTSMKNVFGLLPNTTYQWTIRALCNAAGTLTSDFAPLIQFITTNGARVSNVTEFSVLKDIQAVPNPFTKKTIILLPTNEQRNFRLYDLNGRLLRQWNSKDTRVIIEKDRLVPGVYYLQIEGTQLHNLKLLVEQR